MSNYQTEFNLVAPVNDFEAATAYLLEDDMIRYFRKDHPDTGKYIDSIDWILKTHQSGVIDVVSTRHLTAEELDEVSEFVRAQNADGLGEGFEQEEFAMNDNGDIASFDWENDGYIFEEV